MASYPLRITTLHKCTMTYIGRLDATNAMRVRIKKLQHYKSLKTVPKSHQQLLGYRRARRATRCSQTGLAIGFMQWNRNQWIQYWNQNKSQKGAKKEKENQLWKGGSLRLFVDCNDSRKQYVLLHFFFVAQLWSRRAWSHVSRKALII